ncbi:MAG TPA: arsenosugar biosynthesis radical SAM (seleno)protein ArsS [Chlorobaculum sp.]|nr:arsenosugar biosynthesis radical SAM (seleno)protein ArsS [Chlorobaculum sp.]
MPSDPSCRQTTPASTCSGPGTVNNDAAVPPFDSMLESNGIPLLRASGIDILQVNTGYRCNLRCRHCHVNAGPDRTEVMNRQTMQLCIDVLKSSPIGTIDITGGAAEMNPDFRWFIDQIRTALPEIRILVRSNLTILLEQAYLDIPLFLKDRRVNLIASLPCYTQSTVDSQRGAGVFDRSIEALKRLNAIGYGTDGNSLELSLVYNPPGPVLPESQYSLELEYRKQLLEQFGITFTRLFTITNMPISRFREQLNETGRLRAYMELLASSFNPAAVDGLMCKNTLSVRWDGMLYDCDFNQMLDLPLKPPAPANIRDFDLEKLTARSIATGMHCYGCTAGAGSSCQGSLA